MIKRLLIVIFYICIFSNVRGQLEVVSLNDTEDSFETLETLIVSELFGCNIEISNIDYNGNLEAIGSFNYIQNEDICTGEFGLDRGVLMTTGLIDYAVGPNNDGDNSQSWNTEYVDDFISSGDVRMGRPYPYMIHRIMERNNIISVKHVAKVGDTRNDVLEGKNAGCGITIAVQTGAGTTKDFLQADMIVDKITNIDMIVDEGFFL